MKNNRMFTLFVLAGLVILISLRQNNGLFGAAQLQNNNINACLKHNAYPWNTQAKKARPSYLAHSIYIQTESHGYVRLNGGGNILSMIHHPDVNHYYLSGCLDGRIYGSVNIYDNTTMRLFSMNMDGSGFHLLCEDQPYNTVFHSGGYFYYLNADDSYMLYRISSDGANKTRILDANILHYAILDTHLYYTAASTNKQEYSSNYLYKMNLDGSGNILLADCGNQLPVDFLIEENYLYYTDIGRYSDTRKQFFRMPIAGGPPQPVERPSANYQYFKNTSIDGAIFYFDFTQNAIIQKSFEDQKEIVIAAAGFGNFYVFDNYLYYTATQKGSTSIYDKINLYRLNLTTSENKVLWQNTGNNFYVFPSENKDSRLKRVLSLQTKKVRFQFMEPHFFIFRLWYYSIVKSIWLRNSDWNFLYRRKAVVFLIFGRLQLQKWHTLPRHL